MSFHGCSIRCGHAEVQCHCRLSSRITLPPRSHCRVRCQLSKRMLRSVSVSVAVQLSRATPLPSVESHHTAADTTAAVAAASSKLCFVSVS